MLMIICLYEVYAAGGGGGGGRGGGCILICLQGRRVALGLAVGIEQTSKG